VDEVFLGLTSFNKMAKELGISVRTVCNRIKSLEEKGIIKGYTAIVNPIKIGYGLTAIILIQAEGKHLIEVAKIKHTVSVYDITGDFDIAVIARFKDIFGLNTFFTTLRTTFVTVRFTYGIARSLLIEDFRVKNF